MFVEITTTITTKIDLETFEPTTSVQVEGGESLPADMIYIAVGATCRGIAKQMDERTGRESADEDSDKQ